MFRGFFFIVFIINIRTSSCAIEALYEAGQQVWKLYTIIDNKELNISHDAEATEHLSENSIIREIKKQIDKIYERLNELEKDMGPKTILNAVKSWPLSALLIWRIDTIELFIQNIDEYYGKFHQYRIHNRRSHASYEVLMEGIFSSLEGDIGIIRRFATNEGKSGSNTEDLVAAIAGYARGRRETMCGTPQVVSNILIQLFRMIIIAELKTSTMLAYDNIYQYVEKKDKEGSQRMNSLAREKFEKQFAIYINIFSLNMAVVDTVYNRACDPFGGDWIRNQSFYELERTFQVTLFEYDWGNCLHESCNKILNEQIQSCLPSFYEKPLIRNPENTVSECAFMGIITACKLNTGPYRFQYVNSTHLGVLGIGFSCPKNDSEIIKTKMTRDSIYAACACNFYRNHNKINLLMIESNVESNRVITGLRFVRRNKILYIQPREGILESNGYINKYSHRWISIPENTDCSSIEQINKENRVFYLDDLILSSNFVLTGVKFNKVRRGNLPGFAIEIFGTHFDYKTGKLLREGNFTQSRRGSDKKAGKKLSFEPVSSVFTNWPHTVTPSDTKYVSLVRSTLTEDFGQSTLPLFDAVPITIEVSTALGGVGIFHKGVENYAGLISLRVYGIKYENYFNDFKLSHIIDDRVLFNSSIH